MSATWIKYIAIGLVVLGLVGWLGIPRLLHGFGLHPHYELPELEMTGTRALIITTSHDTLGDTGKATGVFASEMTAPYYAFLDSGMEVDVASIAGGEIPIEPQSLGWPVVSPPDKRFKKDPVFRSKVESSLAIADVDIADYDIVFLAGGWGAAYDFAQSEPLGDQMSKAYAEGGIVGGVCHGPLGLMQARAPSGDLLVAGRRLTAVTDKQINELGITHTPKHPERDLRSVGAEFESNTAFRDFFAGHVVVDGRLVTGQNQNDGTETAVEMMKVLLEQRDRGTS